MQYPGTSPFGGQGGADAMASQLSPHSLDARKRALAQKLAGGRSNLLGGFGGSFGFPGGLGAGMGFADSRYGNVGGGDSPFYGRDGAPETNPGMVFQGFGNGPPPPPSAGDISVGGASGSGAQGVPAAPPTGVDPGVVGGYNPTGGIDPSWIQQLAQLYMGGGAGRQYVS